MSAAVLDDLDLSWVTFSGGEGEPCCECPAQAIAVAVWEVQCDAEPRMPVCAAHRDRIEVIVAANGPWAQCDCGAAIRFLRFEPLR